MPCIAAANYLPSDTKTKILNKTKTKTKAKTNSYP